MAASGLILNLILFGAMLLVLAGLAVGAFFLIRHLIRANAREKQRAAQSREAREIDKMKIDDL
ncbi:MAG: hypothetical protein ACOX83_12015 [Candidatus Spyradocola sp.]|jgi:heme exporter protein D